MFFASVDDAPDLAYLVTGRGARVIIKVMATKAWQPPRPRWSYLPAHVSAVHIVILRSRPGDPYRDAPTVRRTLTGPAADRLARQVNSLPGAPKLAPNYGEMRNDSTALTFDTSRGTIGIGESVTEQEDELSVLGHPTTYVHGNVGALALVAVGLPLDYGKR